MCSAFKMNLTSAIWFFRFDEMAVPYTIVLNKKALNSGIAGLRNRDTTLEVRNLMML